MSMISLRLIDPNPHRMLSTYPLRREKVDYLRASIRETGFWPNLSAREVRGRYEVPFGHHRVQALREELGEDYRIPLHVTTLDDVQMLRMMVRENMGDLADVPLDHRVAVHAVINAVAAGTVVLPDGPKPYGVLAPGLVDPLVIPGVPNASRLCDLHERTWTPGGIAKFLGWPLARARVAVGMVGLVSLGIASKATFSGTNENAWWLLRQILVVLRGTVGKTEQQARTSHAYVARVVAHFDATRKRRPNTSISRAWALALASETPPEIVQQEDPRLSATQHALACSYRLQTHAGRDADNLLAALHAGVTPENLGIVRSRVSKLLNQLEECEALLLDSREKVDALTG